MKRVWLCLLMMVVAGTALAQEEATTEDKKESKLPAKRDLLMIEVTWERLLDTPDGVNQKVWSRGVNLGLFYDFAIGESGLSFAAGAGFSSQNYFTNSQVVRSTDSTTGRTTSALVPFDDSFQYDRNKLSTNFVEVPVEFRFRTKKTEKRDQIKFAVGGKVGYLVNVHSKTVTSEGKFKSFIFPDIRELRYGVSARAGYGRVSLSGFYSLTPLFEDNRGEEYIPISIGISIMPY